MKQVKMLGLAAVAALGLMAMLGAGTASATELCSANASPCEAPNTMYASGTAVSAQLKAGTVANLTNPISNVTCKKSTTTGKTTNTGAKGVAVTGTTETLTFTECETAGAVKCTVETVNLPYTDSITANGLGGGTLTVTKDLSGDPGAKVVCGLVINCTFTTADASLGVTGGNPMAFAKANAITLTQNGVTCPSEAHWDAEYEVTAPKPLFVVNP